MTRLTMPPRRMCSRRSVSGWTTTYQTLSDGRSFSCSCAGLPSTPPSPTAAASRSASLSTTASRREVRLARASLRVPATISAAYSPPEPESPRHRPHPAPRISAYFPQLRFTELDSCRVAVSSTQVTLRSSAPALLLQSPVQRAGRAIGFPDAERRAAARSCRKERSLLILNPLLLILNPLLLILIVDTQPLIVDTQPLIVDTQPLIYSTPYC